MHPGQVARSVCVVVCAWQLTTTHTLTNLDTNQLTKQLCFFTRGAHKVHAQTPGWDLYAQPSCCKAHCYQLLHCAALVLISIFLINSYICISNSLSINCIWSIFFQFMSYLFTSVSVSLHSVFTKSKGKM